uniref:Secreted protein n=1 Tax=Zonotrichia albicollis TaxID=44394 RepID=A0A8D2ML46_ZONAL
MLCVFLAALCALGCESLPSITLCPRAFCWGLSHSSPYPACSKPNDLLSLLWALGKSPHLLHLMTTDQDCTCHTFAVSRCYFLVDNNSGCNKPHVYHRHIT